MQQRIPVKLTIFVVASLALVVALAGTLPASSAPPWHDKVDSFVLDSAVADGEAEFIIFLEEQADLSGAEALESKEDKGQFVYERLAAVAERTQPAVRAALDTLGVAYEPYWVANMIWARGDVTAIERLARRSDVAHLYANPHIQMVEPARLPVGEGGLSPATIEWNIIKVNAPELWNLGITGQNVVIAGQDTGYDWDHPALKEQYRGWDGSTADHNYNWHDAIHSGGGVCGPDSPEPCDDHSHGTHTMGTMVGDDGGANQIGMAPGASWIGCRNMDQGNGTPTTYSECFQWFIAPTDLNGQNPDPSKAPHVINNSWSCPPSEGCTDPNVLLTVVENTRAAGIVVVVSAGNSGSSCSTVNTPAAIYDASYSVGATTSSDAIAGFSSRGPVTVDGSNRLKPDISAPGSGIRSSVPGGGYQGGWSGTSMAGPHVAGLVGLLVSADPSLAGEVAQLEQIISESALHLTSTQTCGGIPGSQIPNNTFGYGRIDALSAYYSLGVQTLELGKEASAATIEPGGTLTYTLTVTNSHPVSPTSNVVLTDVLPAQTELVTATMPFTINGREVMWQQGALAAGEVWLVELVVQTDLTATGDIVNDDYMVRSDEVDAVAGPPVTVLVEPEYWLYLPFIARE